MTLLNVDAGMAHAHLDRVGPVEAPLDVARLFETPGQQTRKVRLQVGYTPKNPDGSYNHTSTYYSELKDDKDQPIGEITLHRPPVLLVHGLWSNSKTWSSGYVNPTPAEGRVVNNKFNYPNAAPFAASTPKLQEWIKTELIGKLRKKEIAATQVDLIAHSMGTLLSRSWLTHPEYRRPDNFKEGDVRKLVALTAPQLGSPIANLLINLHNVSWHLPIFSPMWWMELFLGPVHGGAICDLAERSPSLNFPGAAGVKGLAFTATGGVQGNLHGSLDGFRVFYPQASEQVHMDPYVFRVGQFNDGMVALDSQQGGLPIGQNYGSAVHSDELRSGIGITSLGDAATQIYAQLDTAAGFSTGFPAVQSDGSGVPYSVPGRGAVIDAKNFTDQCAAGMPMNPGMTVAAMQFKQTAAVTQTTAGITVVSPIPGSTVQPGQSIPVVVEVDPSLGASKVVVLANIFKTGIQPIVLNGPPFSGTLVIPMKLTGPIEVGVSANTADDTLLAGAVFSLYVIPADAPIKLEVTGTMYPDLPPKLEPELSRRIHVTGIYADGTRRDIRGAALGTTYTSTNPSIATVDAEGVVLPVAPGIAFILTEHRGLKTYTVVKVSDPTTGNPPPIDQTGNVSMASTGFQLNRELGRYIQSVTITNTSALPLPKPLKFVISGLPSGVELTVDDGKTRVITPIGSPYRTITFDGMRLFMPGASQTIKLGFTNNYGVPITYTARLYTANEP